jgi:hypothetical protein
MRVRTIFLAFDRGFCSRYYCVGIFSVGEYGVVGISRERRPQFVTKNTNFCDMIILTLRLYWYFGSEAVSYKGYVREVLPS